ncbi:MAG: hypothetical protein DMF02_09670 [Verrucomicrobia bacterium]|nr:MAG: hypothetical protein DMF02_09670 [Verrucomicrobiota bacterium]
MALIHCYDCGKEISSLATACPSCGAPPRATIDTSSLPTQTSRAKQFFFGTIAVLTGIVLVLVIRVLTYQPKNLSVATSPTPTTAGSPDLAARETPTEGATTTSPPPVEVASQSSPRLATTETPTGEATTTSSAPIETASQSPPSLVSTKTPYASDVSVATAPPRGATYQVIGIPPSDYLNVREGAGSDYEVVTKLGPGTGGILLGTKRVAKGATTWQEITVNGQTGWVNAAYIALETQAPTSPTESATAP